MSEGPNVEAAIDAAMENLPSPYEQDMEDREAFRRLVIAILSATENWQPIETAPKDGTYVLVYGYRSHVDGSVMHVVRWTKGDGWAADGDDLGEQKPTHWMPLPPPPKQPA